MYRQPMQIFREMITRQTLTAKRDEILRLARENGVLDVRVFGSVARGDCDAQSDVDLLVNLQPGRSLLDLGGFQYSVEELLGVRVDVAMDEGLIERKRARILAEAVPL